MLSRLRFLPGLPEWFERLIVAQVVCTLAAIFSVFAPVPFVKAAVSASAESANEMLTSRVASAVTEVMRYACSAGF